MTGLDCYEFGRRLLAANDLDPVYVLVHEAGLDHDRLKRWLLAYWCFYHVGTASWVSETDFWGRMRTAAGSKDYPRSSERRHFRGENARKSVEFLEEQGIEALFDAFPRPSPSAADVVEYVTEWIGFGPWVAFKVADMLERLGLLDVRFDLDTVMYESPRKAADELYEAEGGPAGVADVGAWAVDRVLSELNPTKAPPRYDRPLSFQEAETVLCKWKSYRGGHYEIGEDVAACRKGLMRFARCRTSQRLLRAGEKGGLW